MAFPPLLMLELYRPGSVAVWDKTQFGPLWVIAGEKFQEKWKFQVSKDFFIPP